MSDKDKPEDVSTILRRAVLKANPDMELLPPTDADLDAFVHHIEELADWAVKVQSTAKDGKPVTVFKSPQNRPN